jgi:O-antigen/teichoic acid export membrane protein
MVVTIPVLAAGALGSRTLQSALFPVQAALPWRIGLPGLILAAIVVLQWTQSTVQLAEVVAVSVAATLVVAGWQWRRTRQLALPELRRDPGAATPRRWLQVSVPMMGFFLVALALNQSDLYFLELLGNEEEVGLYAAAETTAHFLLFIQTSVVGLLAPLVQSAIEAGGEEPRRTRRHGQLVMLAALVPAVGLLVLAGRPILDLFGPAYAQAVPELRLLLLGGFAWAMAALAGLWLQFTGRGTVVVVIAAVTLAVDSALNASLIPTYGMRGAAASTAVTMTLSALAIAVAARRPLVAPARAA